MKCDIKKSGMSLGILFGIMHFAWVVLVTATNGWIVEWIMSLHNVQMEHSYPPFDLVNLIIGTIIAIILGFVIGSLFAIIYNNLGGREAK